MLIVGRNSMSICAAVAGGGAAVTFLCQAESIEGLSSTTAVVVPIFRGTQSLESVRFIPRDVRAKLARADADSVPGDVAYAIAAGNNAAHYLVAALEQSVEPQAVAKCCFNPDDPYDPSTDVYAPVYNWHKVWVMNAPPGMCDLDGNCEFEDWSDLYGFFGWGWDVSPTKPTKEQCQSKCDTEKTNDDYHCDFYGTMAASFGSGASLVGAVIAGRRAGPGSFFSTWGNGSAASLAIGAATAQACKADAGRRWSECRIQCT